MAWWSVWPWLLWILYSWLEGGYIDRQEVSLTLHLKTSIKGVYLNVLDRKFRDEIIEDMCKFLGNEACVLDQPSWII